MSNVYKVLYADTCGAFLEVAEAITPYMPGVICSFAASRDQLLHMLDGNIFDLALTGGPEQHEIHATADRHPRKPANRVVLLDEQVPPRAVPGAAVLNRWLFGFEAIVTHARNGNWQALAPQKSPPRAYPACVEVDMPPPPRLRVLYLGHKDNFTLRPDIRQEPGSTLVKCARLYHVCADVRLDFTTTAEDATRLAREGGPYDLIFAEQGLPPSATGTNAIPLDPDDAESSYRLFSETIDAHRNARYATLRPL